MTAQRTICDLFGVDLHYLTEVVLENPSLRGVIIGYLAEKKLRDWFLADGRITKGASMNYFQGISYNVLGSVHRDVPEDSSWQTAWFTRVAVPFA